MPIVHTESLCEVSEAQATAPPATENFSPSPASVTVPLLGSLLITSTVVSLLCKPPRSYSLSWPHLFALTLIYISIAAITHAIAVWSICKVFREQIEASIPTLIAATWMPVVWVPLLVLSIRKDLIWVALVLPLISIYATLAIKPRAPEGATEAEAPTTNTLKLFQAPGIKSILRAILPAAILAILLQAAVGVLLIGYLLSAGAILSICAVTVIWTTPTKSQGNAPSNPRRTRPLLTASLAAALCTAIALLPFLKANRIANSFGAFLHQRPAAPRPANSDSNNPASSSSYSGVVLLAPARAREKITPPPPPSHLPSGAAFTRPVVIPFDGAYWYFKRPDRRPRPDARIVKGDPTKRQIRSTDWMPLSMEAHQHLGTSIRLSCCSAIRVAIRNADNRLGTISLEILLGDTASKNSTQSLGSKVIRSSENRTVASFNRPPVDETLSFPIPPAARGRSFDQITVVILPSSGNLAGARISIQQFVLEP